MSRLGKKPIVIPQGTTVIVDSDSVSVKGPQGSLSRVFRPDVSVKVEDGRVSLIPNRKDIETMALWGTMASHISNMIAGVNQPFQKKLVVEGIGFKSEVKGEDLNLSLGFSHPVKVKIPKDLKVVAEKNIITVSGPSIELVGKFAAQVRDLKKPEPYKGKGIHYEKEVIRRKQGKKTA